MVEVILYRHTVSPPDCSPKGALSHHQHPNSNSFSSFQKKAIIFKLHVQGIVKAGQGMRYYLR